MPAWLACLAALAVIIAVGPGSALAHYCCGCFSTSVGVSPANPAPGESMTITLHANYCRCMDTQCHGGGFFCAMGPTTVYIELEGYGPVFQHSVEFTATPDAPQNRDFPFSFTPTQVGAYTAYASGPCGVSSPTYFAVGCDGTCEGLGGENACPSCPETIPAPTIQLMKSDNIIRTVCPTDCEAENEDAKGERVTIRVNGGSARCYTLNVQASGAVEVLSPPPSQGTWTGELSFEVQGLIGVGSVSVTARLFDFDADNMCWKESSEASATFQARPDDDCECPDCPAGGRGRNGGAVRAVPVLGTLSLGDVELSVHAGRSNLLRVPKIVAVHPNGDVEVLLPDRANPVVFRPDSGFLEGWVLGGLKRDFIQLSNIFEGRTYRFESTAVGPYPYRLQKIKRLDGSTHSSYVYDVNGVLTEVHVGAAVSTTYFELAYDGGGNLATITPVVNGVADLDRAISLVWDGDLVIGADGIVCPTCGGDSRRYYFDAGGLLVRVTNRDGIDLEYYTYDTQDRLIQHDQLDMNDVMVTDRVVEYAEDGDILVVSHHERVSDAEERIQVEYYDDAGRIIQVDRYVDLFPHGSIPSGDVLTTTYGYLSEEDPDVGITVETFEITNPAGVADVSVVKTFADGLPVFLPDDSESEGWVIPNESFEMAGMQEGDAALCPQIAGSTATTTFEVAVDGTYQLYTLVHPAAGYMPGDYMCVEYSVAGGGGTFFEGYGYYEDGDPWLRLYDSCEDYGVAGHEHAGWDLLGGETYVLTVVFVDMVPAVNLPEGWGVDAVALSRFEADPALFPTASYQAVTGRAQYQRQYVRGTDGSVTRSSVVFYSFNPNISSYQTLYRMNPHGGVTDYTYDNMTGMVVLEEGPAVLPIDWPGMPVRYTQSYVYDDNNRLVRKGVTSSDASGEVFTDYTYDEYGRVLTMTEDADGAPAEQAVTQHTYSIYGEQTTTTDPCGNVTENVYGVAGRLQYVVGYAGALGGDVLAEAEYEYDQSGYVVRVSHAFDTQPFPLHTPAEWADTVYTRDLMGRKLSESVPGPGGGTLITTIAYDYQDQVIEQVNPDGSIARLTYNGAGLVTSESLEGTGVAPLLKTHTYNGVGQLVGDERPDTGLTTYEYDVFGRVSAVIDAARTEYTYDLAGDRTRKLVLDATTSDAISDETVDYDVLGRMIRRRARLEEGVDGADDPLTLTGYDAAGRVRAVIGKANGSTDENAYEAGDQYVLNTHNALGQRISRVDGVGQQIDYAYDLCDRLISRTVDPANLALATTYQYDALDRLARQTDPAGYYTETVYDTQGQPVQVTQHQPDGTPLSRSITEYDSGGRRLRSAVLLDPTATTIDNATDAVEEQVYDAVGQVESVMRYADGVARAVTLEYDGIGRRTVVHWPVEPATNRGEFEYDAVTGLVSRRVEHDALGAREALYAYDEFGRNVTTTVHGAGVADRATTRVFDALGRKLEFVSPDGQVQRQEFDLAGHTTHTYEDDAGLGRHTEWGFDRLGRTVNVTAYDDDGPPQVTTYDFDAAGRLQRKVASDGAEVALQYDSAGRVISESDPRGFVIAYTYDNRDMRVARTITDPGFGISDTFAYDGLRRMTLAKTDADNEVQFAYNPLGHQTQQTQKIAGVSRVIDITRNQLAERKSISVPSGPVVTYEYDAQGMPTVIRRDSEALINYAFAGGRVTQRDILLDADTTVRLAWGYDSHHRATSMANTVVDPEDDLFVYTYAVNEVGSPVSESRTGVDEPEATTYEYDGLRRVTAAEHTGRLPGREEFAYDVLSNRLSASGRLSDVGEPDTTYTQGEANEYASIDGTALTYDDAGNLAVDENGYQFKYDYAHRIVEIKDASSAVVATYQYDALGRRTVTNLNGETIHYVYDDEENVLAEFNAAGQRLRYYVHGRTNVDERAVLHDDDVANGGAGAADYAYALKNLYSVAGLVDADGQAVERYTYDAYGNVRINIGYAGDIDGDGDIDNRDFATFQRCFAVGDLMPECIYADINHDGAVDWSDYEAFATCMLGPGQAPPYDTCVTRNTSPLNTYFFTGRRLDCADEGRLRVQYNRRRYYSPEHGRWYSRDPLGIMDSANLYQYADSRPTLLSDPTGMVSIRTPWVTVDIEDGCVAINKDIDGPGDDKYFAGGKGKLSYAFGLKVTGSVCKVCCKKGKSAQNMVGQEVYDIRVKLEGSATGGVEFRPWGVYVEWGWPLNIGLDAWAGIKIGASLTGTVSGWVGSDKCWNRNLTGEVCFEGSLTATLAGGAEIKVIDLKPDPGEDPLLFKVAATLNGSLTVTVTKCYNCRGESCSWKPATVCFSGKAWIEATIWKWGVDIPLGSFNTCD